MLEKGLILPILFKIKDKLENIIQECGNVSVQNWTFKWGPDPQKLPTEWKANGYDVSMKSCE